MKRCIPELSIVKCLQVFFNLVKLVSESAQSGISAHQMEKLLFEGLLKLGACLLDHFFKESGDGDFGDSIEVEFPSADGSTETPTLYRSKDLRSKQYRSIFGKISIHRYCYTDGEKTVYPYDQDLCLPKDSISYLLQKWVQGFCVHDSFAEATHKLDEILGTSVAVRTGERLSREVTEDISSFREIRPSPPASEEGEILVLSADGKGVPITKGSNKTAHNPNSKGLLAPREKGPKLGRKKVACVTTVYSVDRYRRSSQDIVCELADQNEDSKTPRPKICHKEVRADLLEGKDAAFVHLVQQASTRGKDVPLVFLADGERKLWEMKRSYLPEATGILDIFHVMERVWDVAYAFHGEGNDLTKAWVIEWLKSLLDGHVGRVIGGWRQRLTKNRVSGERRKTVEKAINYFERNRNHMHYDVYLKEGFPIASGAVEGTCRHLVKDRMERTGMRWCMDSAQAMLDLRALRINGQWDVYWDYHIEQDQKRIYPDLNRNNDYTCKAA